MASFRDWLASEMQAGRGRVSRTAEALQRRRQGLGDGQTDPDRPSALPIALTLTAAIGLGGWFAYRSVARMLNPDDPEIALAAGRALFSKPHRVLAVTTHPDDLELFAGGTLRRFGLADGHVSIACLCTEEIDHDEYEVGGASNEDLLSVCDRIAMLRVNEVDLNGSDRLAAVMSEVWEETEPELVIAPDPDRPLRFAANRYASTIAEGLRRMSGSAANQPEILYYGTRNTNILADVTGVIDEKLDAILFHCSRTAASQLAYAAVVRLLGRATGSGAGLRYGESFRTRQESPLLEIAFAEARSRQRGATWRRSPFSSNGYGASGHGAAPAE